MKNIKQTTIWTITLIAWFCVICFVPDPRPLGAPEPAVDFIEKLLGLSTPASRVLATLSLRGLGLATFGILVVFIMGKSKGRIKLFWCFIIAQILAILAQLINYGYFPVRQQILLATFSTVLGVLSGFMVMRSLKAFISLTVLSSSLFLWGFSTGISDNLYNNAKATAEHILEESKKIPKNDESFIKLLEIGFGFASDNSHHHSSVETNKATILALGTILGEEKLVKVAKRKINFENIEKIKKLRQRITLLERSDLSQHFWVSAALTVLSNGNQSMDAGIMKELMDSQGGSGFSFVDLTADRAGVLFAINATCDEASARKVQDLIREGAKISDFMPNALDLPEKITSTDFQEKFGGLGGKKTKLVVDEIRQRLSNCQGLN